MTRAVEVSAFAKINLGLRVLYKRPDNYHELRTVFQTVSLADRLNISWTPGRVRSITIEGAPEIPDNIAARAASLMLDHLALGGQVHINLRKKIPSGAGLGGGSSDAAAVLLALPVLIGRKLPIEDLTRLASVLGSDVPFFLQGGRVLGIGRGEELYPLPETTGGKGLIIAPAIHSSTAVAYGDLSATLTLIALQNKLNSFQTETWLGSEAAAVNDFEPVVSARHPRIGQIVRRLKQLGASMASMTGSGSAVFGIFNDPECLSRALAAFPDMAFPDEQCFPISFLNRRQYRARWHRALASHTGASNSRGAQTWPPLSRHDNR
jgi:4-diphosphocytidyl-2-C-methyl-D-erythritol kinase